MTTSEELSQLKYEFLNKIKYFAQKEDISSLSVWSKAVEQCELLINELTDLTNRISEFKTSLPQDEKRSNIASVSNLKTADSPISQTRVSAKQEGARVRASWVQKLASKGTCLKGYGKNYYTANGKSVGVASANELNGSQHVNKWFLGLKDEPKDIVVLICRDLKKVVHDFVIPFIDLKGVWKKLSRSKGEVKFNIRKQNGNYFLAIPRNTAIPISKYLGNYTPFSKDAC